MASPILAARRHQMVRVQPEAWAVLLDSRPDLAAEPLLPRWAERGWPLIVRQRLHGDMEGAVPLGLPLPPALGRQRFMLCLPPKALTRFKAPPTLCAAANAAPAAWSATIGEILALDETVRCFGALAWQHLTGLPYLTRQSDIDLIWAVSGRLEADRLGDGLRRIDESAPMRIDGEFSTASYQSVHWREWAGGSREVMVKGSDGVELVRRDCWLT